MEDKEKKSKASLRARAEAVKDFRCKNLIAVIEHPDNVLNIGSIIRNVNALGVEKIYVITNQNLLADTWEEMRTDRKLNSISSSAIKWSFVKTFKDTKSCMEHLKENNFISAVTSPHMKGHKNVVLHEHDYTKYKKLAIWFGNEGIGISDEAISHSDFCINIPMCGIIESLNLGTSSGIMFYEITKQRRAFQLALKNKAAGKSLNQQKASE